MELLAHIVDRFLIHFFASGGLLIAGTLGYSFAKRWFKNIDRYESTIVTALLIVWLTATREAYDVYNGGPLIKSIADFISWTLGVTVWGIGLEFLKKWK